MTGFIRRQLVAASFCVFTGITFSAPVAAEPGRGGKSLPAAFTELVEQSLQERSGLTFFIDGQALPAVVTKIIDPDTIEGRSQQYERIVIRLRHVSAIARQ